jgi:hypothetical protein
MKKIFIQLAVLLAVCITTYAQPTITGAGSNPIAGEIYYGHHFDTAGRSAGASGAGVTWNYITANVYQIDTTLFVSCSSTPYCDSFPGSTLASADGFGGYEYYITDASRFAYNGYSSGGTDNDHLSKPQVIIPYPFTYGNVRADSFSEAQFGLGLYQDGVDSFIADAYGTLQLPPMFFSSVLRIHHINYTRDSMAGVSPATYYRTENYIWVSPNLHFPLLILSYDTIGNVRYISDIAFYTKDVTGVPGMSMKNGQLSVYPNPASGTAQASYVSSRSGDAIVVVTDFAGRAMLAPMTVHLSAGTNEIRVDVSSMPRGIYMLQVNAGDDRRAVKLVVE